MIDPVLIMAGSGVGLAGVVAYKALFDKPKSERGWMTPGDARKYGLCGNERTGIIIGRQNGKILSDKSSNHFGFNGPTGSGKSSTLTMTLLLNTRYSIIVSDPSGELWRLTSGIRSTYGPVYRLDPSEPNSSLYNPFDDILCSDNMYAELQNMFRSLIKTADKEQAKSDPHWSDKPVELSPAYATQLLLGDDPSRKNFAALLRYIRSGRAALEDMFNNPSHPKCREVAQSLLGEIGTGNSPYLGSLISVLSNPLSMWDDSNVQRMTSGSSFRIDELATGDKDGRPITLYMTAPAKDLARLTPFYRMVRDMTKMHLLYRKQVTFRGEQKRRIVLSAIDETQDEAPEKLDKTLAICRKFGIRYATGWQSLDAAESMYGKHFLGLLKSNVTYRPTVGDNVVKRLSAMSGWYEKFKLRETESKKGMLWLKSSRSTEKEWKHRLEEWDFERWPEFGISMYTHPGKPGLMRMTDVEADPFYKQFILPEYVLPEPRRMQSPWDNDVPMVSVPQAANDEEEPFMDIYSDPSEFDGDEDIAVV